MTHLERYNLTVRNDQFIDMRSARREIRRLLTLHRPLPVELVQRARR